MFPDFLYCLTEHDFNGLEKNSLLLDKAGFDESIGNASCVLRDFVGVIVVVA